VAVVVVDVEGRVPRSIGVDVGAAVAVEELVVTDVVTGVVVIGVVAVGVVADVIVASAAGTIAKAVFGPST
jgi:hypothetical protein